MNKPFEMNQTGAAIKEFINKILKLKVFYIVCLVTFLSAAFLFNRYSIRVYQISAIIGPVKDDRELMLASNDLFRGFGTYSPGTPIENDITNLLSFNLVSSAITSLNQEVGYFKVTQNIFKQVNELYNDSPFFVKIDKSYDQPIYAQFYIKFLNDSTYRIIASEEDISIYNYLDNAIVSEHQALVIDTIGKFNKTISGKDFRFMIVKNTNGQFRPNDTKDEIYFFELYNLDYLTKFYLRNINVNTLSPASSMIKIDFNGENLEKIITFLNKYIELYISDNLEKKNKKSISTINFIDSQLAGVSDSLVNSEYKLRSYRSNNQVIDLSFQGQRIYQQISEIEAQQKVLQVQSRYYSSVVSFLRNNTDLITGIPPTSTEVEDPIINQMISDLIYLVERKSGIVDSRAEKSLFLEQIDNKIIAQRRAITEHANHNLNSLNISLNELDYKIKKLNEELSRLPNAELNLVNMQRKFTLDDAIYTFLLQKRSEAAIAMASNYPDYELVEPARFVTSDIKKPKESINYFLAFFFAIMIPTTFLIIKDFFSDKISNPNVVSRIINRAAIGIIPRNDLKTESVMTDYSRSSIAEAFRNIRSNLFFKMKEQPNKVIVISSSQPQDGKSFISYNLASSIASVGRKTIIIDGDMHKPTLHKKFKMENIRGLSDYMNNNATIEDIIQQTSSNNLDIITAGPTLPNPAELIELGVLDELFTSLSEIYGYEYILVDTPPTGVITDAILFMRYATQILIVCRNNRTSKYLFSGVIESLERYNFENYDVIFNDQGAREGHYKKYNSYYTKNKVKTK